MQLTQGLCGQLRYEISILRPQSRETMSTAEESGSNVEPQVGCGQGSGAQCTILLDDVLQHQPVRRPPLAQRPHPAPRPHRGEVKSGVGALKAVGEPWKTSLTPFFAASAAAPLCIVV